MTSAGRLLLETAAFGDDLLESFAKLIVEYSIDERIQKRVDVTEPRQNRYVFVLEK